MGTHYSTTCSSLLSSPSVQPPCSPSTLTVVSVSTLEKWLTCAQQEALWLIRWLLLWQLVLNNLSQQGGHLIEREEKAKERVKEKEKAREKGKNALQWMNFLRILRKSLEIMSVYTMLWVGLMKKEMLTMTPSPWT